MRPDCGGSSELELDMRSAKSKQSKQEGRTIRPLALATCKRPPRPPLQIPHRTHACRLRFQFVFIFTLIKPADSLDLTLPSIMQSLRRVSASPLTKIPACLSRPASTSLLHHRYHPRHAIQAQSTPRSRSIHSSPLLRDSSFVNILAGDTPPPVMVNSITDRGIQLADGLIIPSSCVFLEGQVFLWDVPSTLWSGWTTDHLEVFEVVVPKPGTCSCYASLQSQGLM